MSASSDLAQWLMDLLAEAGVDGQFDEPDEDVRSGGHFFEVEHLGRRLTVLVVDEDGEEDES